MSYTINKTNGSVFAVVPDGTINAESSQVLVGKNYAGYGEFFGENFIRLLESAANDSAPTTPLAGQLWFDTQSTVLKVYNGVNFKNLGAASSDTTEPENPVIGDLWYNPTDKQLFVYTGAEWLLVGPSFTAGSGVSGAIVDVIDDQSLNPHTVVKLYVEDEIVSIISKDTEFTPNSTIPGFTSILPGIQLATSVGTETPLFQGTAVNALNLLDNLGESISTDSFVRNDVTTPEKVSGGLWIDEDLNGLDIGQNKDFHLSVLGGDAFIENIILNGSITSRVTTGTGTADVLKIDADGLAHALYTVQTNSPSDTVVNKVYVDDAITAGVGDIQGVLKSDGSVDIIGILKPNLNGATDLGTTTNKFKDVYATNFVGTSSRAKYADLAERFEIDKAMPAGTVVELGGAKEITKSIEEFSDDVFGVISTSAAYLMNCEAGDDNTHPPVAMNGRVPVRVIGKVKKGDRLVSAGNGLAQSATSSNITAFNVIGRSLQNKETESEGVVEAIVRIN